MVGEVGRLFVYGTLPRGGPNHGRFCGDALTVGPARTAGRLQPGHGPPSTAKMATWCSPVRGQGRPTSAQGATFCARATQGPSASREAAPWANVRAHRSRGRPLRPSACLAPRAPDDGLNPRRYSRCDMA